MTLVSGTGTSTPRFYTVLAPFFGHSVGVPSLTSYKTRSGVRGRNLLIPLGSDSDLSVYLVSTDGEGTQGRSRVGPYTVDTRG